MKQKFYKSVPNEEYIPLTDGEIEWIANVLLLLAEIPDWKQRCRLIAIACKIGIFEEDNPSYELLREKIGLTRR